MTAKVAPKAAALGDGTLHREPTKEELQQRVDVARESISQTVGEIRETVEDQYASVKTTVSGILNWREGFVREPLVWSVGALAAGFALGYTIGVGRKRRGSSPALTAFTEGLMDELRIASESLPLATIDPHMRAVLGFDLSELLTEIRDEKRPSRRTVPQKRGDTSRRRRRKKRPT